MTRPDHPPARAPLALACLLVLALALAGCRRGPPLPQVSGPLADVVLRAAFEGENGSAPTQPLMLHAESFTRLGSAVRGTPLSEADLRAQIGRPFVLVDARDVLVCPERHPCHVADDGVYVEIWEAERKGNQTELVVTRVQNVRGLYVMTHAVTHRMTIAETPAGWRITRLQRLPT